MGLDRAADDRHPVPVRLSAVAVHRIVRSVPHRGRGRGRIAALSHAAPASAATSTSGSIYYYGFSELDVQSQIPIIHPVLDYSNVLAQPIFDGELSYKVNLTSLTRQDAEFDAITQSAADQNLCASNNPPSSPRTTACCAASRAPIRARPREVDWRRTFVTNNGQMITPFLRVRGDVAALEVAERSRACRTTSTPGKPELARVMPDRRRRISLSVRRRGALGYADDRADRAAHPAAERDRRSASSPTRTPRAWCSATANLFSIDKFSGWDRVEGGGRVNAGLQYTAQVNRAGSFNALFGQSYQTLRRELLLGRRSHQYRPGERSRQDASPTMSARVTYQPNQIYSFTAARPFRSADLSRRNASNSRAAPISTAGRCR